MKPYDYAHRKGVHPLTWDDFASLVSHTWASPAPQVVALVTDAFVIFPWDRQVYVDGHWQPHPEVEKGLVGLLPDHG